MAGRQPHALSRLLLGTLALFTLAGQILEAERAPQVPALSMSIRDARVVSVSPGGAADSAGIRRQDIIKRVGDRAVPPSGRALPLLRQLRSDDDVTLELLRGGERLQITFRLPPPPAGEVLWRLALAMVGIVTVLVGVLVFFKKPRGLTLIFAGVCYGMGYLFHPPYIPPVGWIHALAELVLDAMTLMIPAFFVHLFLLFPVRHSLVEKRPMLVLLLYAPSILILALSQSLRLKGIAGSSTAHALTQLTHGGASLLWVAGVVAALALFVHSYRRARTSTARRNVRVILWGTILGALPAALLLIIHQLWPAFRCPVDRLAIVFTVLIPLSFGYAIVKHGVFDSTVLVRRSLALSVLSAFLVLAYFAISLLLRSVFLPTEGEAPLWISFVSMLAVVLLFIPAQQEIRSLMAKTLSSNRPEQQSLLHDFGQALRGVLERDRLVRVITDSMAVALGAEHLAFLERSDDACLEAAYLYGIPATKLQRYRFTQALSQRMNRITGAIELGDLETDLPFGYISPTDQEALEAIGAEILVPLRTGTALAGLVLVGERTLSEPFTSEDLQLAETMAGEGAVALENALLHEQAQEEERLREDVGAARDLQERLLPGRMPQVESLEISGYSIPCQGVGGDYYDCFRTPWGEIVLAIGDASGKGVPGAILMANLQALVKTEARRSAEPWRIVQRINERLCEMRKPERYITFCLARIDPLTGTLAYCSAGHPGLLVVRSDGTIEELSRGGLPLGIRPQAAYEGGQCTLRAGDLLLLYTDGITERWNGTGEFGKERLHQLLRRNRRSSAKALEESILNAVREFATSPLSDDTTLLLVKVL